MMALDEEKKIKNGALTYIKDDTQYTILAPNNMIFRR